MSYESINDVDHKVSTITLRNKYKSWCEDHGTKYHLNSFISQIRRIGIDNPLKVRINGKRISSFIFNTNKLQDNMRSFLKDKSYSFEFGEIIEVDESENDDCDCDSDC